MRITLITNSKAELLLAYVCHTGTAQSRWSKIEELQIDQNQCRHLGCFLPTRYTKHFKLRGCRGLTQSGSRVPNLVRCTPRLFRLDQDQGGQGHAKRT